MTTYIVSVKVPSKRAAEHHGHPYVWKGHVKYRGHLPTDKTSFHTWILHMLGNLPLGIVKVIRPQAHGESPGFKLCFYGYVDEHAIIPKRLTEKYSGDVHKPVPGVPDSRQPWYWRDWNNVRPSGRFRGSAFGHPPKDRGKEKDARFGG